MVRKRIEKLREVMKREGLSAWLVTANDAHGQEMPEAHDKELSYFIGFDVTAGSLVVTLTEAAFFTDSRYVIAAGHALSASDITVINSQMAGSMSVPDFICKHLGDGDLLGFDGKTIPIRTWRRYQEIFSKKGISMVIGNDLVDAIWEDRPAVKISRAWIYDGGKSCKEKLTMVRRNMLRQGASVHVLTSLCDIAWLTNLRGSDQDYTPVIKSFMIIDQHKAVLYGNEQAVNEEVLSYLRGEGVTFASYDSFCHDLKTLSGTVLLDESLVGSYFVDCMPDSVRILNRMNPETLMKSVKNETEKRGMKEAHIRDGVCMVKFLYWLKKNVSLREISESEAADYLDNLRRGSDGFLMNSFETISAYGKNAAMVHYHAVKGEDSVLRPVGLYLCDSGAHYVDGTTDVTRTIALGKISEDERFHFTIALKSLIALSDASFLYRTSCSQIDIFARGPLWQYGIDCPHTTGHGVGCVLDVHEGPNIFAWQLKNPDPVISDGMITSGEPGIYVEDRHGIRHENLLLAVKDASFKAGKQFMHFETLTLVPFDTEALDLSYLTKREIQWLDAYHEIVYEGLSPFLDGEVKVWLREICRPLGEK